MTANFDRAKEGQRGQESTINESSESNEDI